ncbi:MAG: phosphoadenosine phosphosulfate reductase family protein [Dehalococcoidia bacterium]
MKHIVALSGGKDSTAMALRLAEVEPQDYDFICTPTGDELPDMVEHWVRLGKLLGKPIRPVVTGVSLGSLIEKWDALPNWRMRWCTRVLKIEPFQAILLKSAPAVCYVGIRADEMDREGVDFETIGGITRRFPLQEWGWGLKEVIDYLDEREIEIPPRTDCAVCFFQTIEEWHDLWKNHPDRYEKGEMWEAITGYTFRSEKRDTWPAGLLGLRKEFERGRLPRKRGSMAKRKVMCSFCSR